MRRTISDGQRSFFIAAMEQLLAIPEIDFETERRALWLKWHLEGRDPLGEIDRKLAAAA